jgi:hypothetical protein
MEKVCALERKTRLLVVDLLVLVGVSRCASREREQEEPRVRRTLGLRGVDGENLAAPGFLGSRRGLRRGFLVTEAASRLAGRSALGLVPSTSLGGGVAVAYLGCSGERPSSGDTLESH